MDLLSNSLQELASLTDKLNTNAKKYGMEINADKTKHLSIGPNEQNQNIYIDSDKIESVTFFKYLGAHITAKGDSTKEIKTRIALATSSLTRLKTL